MGGCYWVFLGWRAFSFFSAGFSMFYDIGFFSFFWEREGRRWKIKKLIKYRGEEREESSFTETSLLLGLESIVCEWRESQVLPLSIQSL